MQAFMCRLIHIYALHAKHAGQIHEYPQVCTKVSGGISIKVGGGMSHS